MRFWLKLVRSINVIHFILDSAFFGSFQIFSYILWGDEVSCPSLSPLLQETVTETQDTYLYFY